MEVEVLQVRGKSWLIFISLHNHSSSFAKGEGNPVMQATVTPQQRQAAKREIVRQMKQGASTHEARVRSIVPMHRTTVYRLLKRVQREGESSFSDGRHGHPVKLCGEALAFLKEHCQSNPSASSSAVQRLLQERLDLCISVSQLNRVRASLGLSRKLLPREKKASNRSSD
jgi:transposase